MTSKNVFSGIRMEYQHVQYWCAFPNFGYFVFQPAIDDFEVGAFTLIAYPVDKTLEPLNGGVKVTTSESDYNSFTATLPNTKFANNYLSLAQLTGLYPPGGAHLDLAVYPACGPQPYYPGTDYVQYEAATAIGTEFFQYTSVDPSPPHHI